MPEPGKPQDFNRFSYTLNNPLRYTDPSGHCIPGVNCPGDNNDEVGGFLPESERSEKDPNLSSPPSTAEQRTFLWGLYAIEMGPRNEKAEPLIDQVFDPFPSFTKYMSSEQRSHVQELRLKTLKEGYGGWEGLENSVTEACLVNRCNNDVLGGSWRELSIDIRNNAAFVLQGRHQEPTLAYFLREVGASTENLYNYEPYWMAELMRQYPDRLMISEGKWVRDVYVSGDKTTLDFLRYYGDTSSVVTTP